MLDEIKTIAEQHGAKCTIISVDRLEWLKNDLDELRNDLRLSGSQRSRIAKSANVGGIPDKTRSIILLAVPCAAAYVNLFFRRNGKEYQIFGLAPTYKEPTEKLIMETIANAGYTVSDAGNSLPLKRLAVQSGLAEYGKNNITYVKGLGSYLSYYAYYTDMPCEADTWRKAVVSPFCEHCDICLHSCPTGSITKDCFMIDSGKCMRRINSDNHDFPDWLPPTAHHTVFGCLKCQGRCPINAERTDVIDVYFDETETDIILGGTPKKMPEELKRKCDMLWYLKSKTASRNLHNLLSLMDSGYTPCL
ncbi:MAG: hypothetical protein FWG72_00575 [Oscillospiraceae bacterium]|nr:hypothetical protein [Oscillospiraceae bacterium]